MIPIQPRAVVIHDLAQAIAALRAATEHDTPIVLLSAPGAAAYAGIGWFDAVIRRAAAEAPDADFIAVLDCADRADLVQAALRQGLKHVGFAGDSRIVRKLNSIAARYGATIHRKRPAALDLLDHATPMEACLTWLARPAARAGKPRRRVPASQRPRGD